MSSFESVSSRAAAGPPHSVYPAWQRGVEPTKVSSRNCIPCVLQTRHQFSSGGWLVFVDGFSEFTPDILDDMQVWRLGRLLDHPDLPLLQPLLCLSRCLCQGNVLLEYKWMPTVAEDVLHKVNRLSSRVRTYICCCGDVLLQDDQVANLVQTNAALHHDRNRAVSHDFGLAVRKKPLRSSSPLLHDSSIIRYQREAAFI